MLARDRRGHVNGGGLTGLRRNDRAPEKLRLSATGLALLLLAGCSSIGPVSVARNRIDYGGAMAESWKEQTLLNIVRLRYADAPVFLDISSVIGSYALQGQVTANGVLATDSPNSLVNLGANATYLDRPTISYIPLIGDRFTGSLLRPIPPAAVFSLIQAGYAADFVLWVTVRASIADRAIVPIRSGSVRPDNAFVATHYRGSWFWIDDRNFEAKRAFTFLMMFFSLAETGVAPQAPVITLPAN